MKQEAAESRLTSTPPLQTTGDDQAQPPQVRTADSVPRGKLFGTTTRAADSRQRSSFSCLKFLSTRDG